MANYYGTARTNYFKIKPDTDFEHWLSTVPGVEAQYGATNDVVTLLFEDSVPSYRDNPETGETEDLDFMGELAEHLADEEVAIVIEAGHEKMRYIVGFAEAINNKGKRQYVSLEQIYNLAKPLGKNITRAEY